MKKKILGKQLSRGQGSRKALYRSLVRALAENGSITTTKAKADFLKERIDKLVNKAKNETVSGKRSVYAFLGNDRTTSESIAEIAKHFAKRTGGFTRTINLPQRRGDSAKMARIEWVEEIVLKSKETTEKSKKTKETKKQGSEEIKSEKTKTKKTSLLSKLKLKKGKESK